MYSCKAYIPCTFICAHITLHYIITIQALFECHVTKDSFNCKQEMSKGTLFMTSY